MAKKDLWKNFLLILFVLACGYIVAAKGPSSPDQSFVWMQRHLWRLVVSLNVALHQALE